MAVSVTCLHGVPHPKRVLSKKITPRQIKLIGNYYSKNIAWRCANGNKQVVNQCKKEIEREIIHLCSEYGKTTDEAYLDAVAHWSILYGEIVENYVDYIDEKYKN